MDALKGIEVNSEYSFTTIDGYTFQKGYNYLDGNQALSFVRERQSFSGGDRIRIKNQALVLKALINKLTSPSIIVNYSSLLKTLSSSFVTNIDMNSLTKFIKNEIANPKLWQIINYSLEGTDSYEYTYSYPSTKLYVMMPSEDSLTISKSKIKEILNQ